jgi:organic hydroperoxide reductase OsmC/OhrA
MSEQKQFTIELDQLQGYEFKVRFDLDGVEPLLVDEPAPIGQGQGPNPSRLVAAAAANCLGASLLYCVSKNQPPQGSLRASATCTLGRNEKGRLRITGIDVRLELAATLEQAARTKRCLDLFEDFCVVSASLRDGFPVSVAVLNERGEILHRGVA